MNTPRTDKACFDSFEHPLTHQNCEVVKADFARQLETELAEMREALERVLTQFEINLPSTGLVHDERQAIISAHSILERK